MNVGLRAVMNVVNVGLHALVNVSLCAMNVGLRAVIFCMFWKPPCIGEVLPKFSTYSVVFLVL